jgi:hypothetical protein
MFSHFLHNGVAVAFTSRQRAQHMKYRRRKWQQTIGIGFRLCQFNSYIGRGYI